MADSVGSVHVEFTTSTANFRAEVAKGAQAVEGFSAAAKRSAQGAAQAAGASGTYTASFGKLGEQVRGASASIGGFSQAFAAMGAKVSPAIKGLGSSLSALLAGGFTPLGVGIGLATAAMSAWIGRQQEASKRSEELTKRLDEQRAKFQALVDATEKAEFARGFRGSDKGLIEIERAVDDARSRLEQARRDMASATGPGGATGAAYAEAKRREVAAEGELARLSNERLLTLRRITAETERAVSVTEDAAYQAQRNREVLDALHPGRNDVALSIPADYEFGQTDPMDPRTAEDTAAANLARRERDRLYDERLRLVIEENRAEAMFAEQMREWEERQSGANGAEGADPTKGAERIAGDTWRPHRIEAERALTSIEVMSQRAAESFSDGFGNAFADFATGAASAGEAFKSFASSFLTDIVQMIAKQAALSALMGGASAVGLAGLFGGGAGAEATASLGGIGFATGGSFKVRGTGGTDSQPVAFWATPGEQVDVRTPGQMAKGGGGVTVNVFNSAPNTSVRTESREGPDGMEIRAYVEQVVSSDLERGGPISRTAERTHGLQRRGRRG